MTKSANDNVMTRLDLIRVMLVGVSAWRKTEMQNFVHFFLSPIGSLVGVGGSMKYRTVPVACTRHFILSPRRCPGIRTHVLPRIISALSFSAVAAKQMIYSVCVCASVLAVFSLQLCIVQPVQA